MKIQEKLRQEDGCFIRLYKEGAFWIAYEQSAYALSQYKTLKVSKKHVKVVNAEVVSVGFPGSTLAFFFSRLGNPAIQSDTFIELKLENTIEQQAYLGWKSALPLYAKPQANTNKIEMENSPEASITKLVLDYPLGERTPIDALLFVKELKALAEVH